jgi:hypothetical protein
MMQYWRQLFDARQLKEIDFAQVYAKEFNHGTDGHNRLLLIDRMTKVLDTLHLEPEFLDKVKELLDD